MSPGRGDGDGPGLLVIGQIEPIHGGVELGTQGGHLLVLVGGVRGGGGHILHLIHQLFGDCAAGLDVGKAVIKGIGAFLGRLGQLFLGACQLLHFFLLSLEGGGAFVER